MDYVSTRGMAPQAAAPQALLAGLAPDGGLYVPARPLDPLPPGPTFRDTLLAVLLRFFGELPHPALAQAVDAALARFDLPDALAFRDCGDAVFLELFHGPTLAFKDIALTLLPHLLALASAQTGGGGVRVLTATSGDTGSAAMAGFADVPGARLLALYPASGISEVQRRQMVCQPGANVSAIGLRGNFDDAQRAVKAAFADPELRARAQAAGCHLTSANSINVGRLFPQVAYYLHAAARMGGAFDVCVPTGNFGDILAAWYARLLGAPIGRLAVACNANRVVCDFVRTGRYDARRPFHVTNAPSMDILVSSNVERLLWLLTQGNAVKVRTWQGQLQAEGWFQIEGYPLHDLRADWAASWADPEETERAIADVWERFGYLIDPHTAIAWKTLRDLPPTGRPTLIAATASPWKFPRAVLRALTRQTPPEDDFEAMEALAAHTRLAPSLSHLRHAPILHDRVADLTQAPQAILDALAL